MTQLHAIVRILKEVDEPLSAREVFDRGEFSSVLTVANLLSDYSSGRRGEIFIATGATRNRRYTIKPGAEVSRQSYAEEKAEKAARRERELKAAIRGLLDGYDRILVTIPKTSLAFGIVEGAMSPHAAIAAKVLAS